VVTLVDAAGQVVGPVFPSPAMGAIRGHALIRANDRAGFVLASADRFLTGLRGNLPQYALFEDPGCLGPAYVSAPTPEAVPELFRRTAIGPDGQLRVADGGVEPRVIQGRWLSDSVPPTCDPVPPGPPEPVIPTVPFLDLTRFTPPLAVR
jgi:hypothetical protein